MSRVQALETQLRNWWEGRTNQEQRLLTIGAPVIVFLVLYIAIIQPFVAGYSARAELRDGLASDIHWMLEQRDLVATTKTYCDPRLPVVTLDALKSSVEEQARRLGLRVQVSGVSNNAVTLDASNVDANRALSLVKNLACSGLSVNAVSLQTNPQNAQQANVRLRVGVLP